MYELKGDRTRQTLTLVKYPKRIGPPLRRFYEKSYLLLRDKVDLGTVKLGLEVVRVSSEENERAGEESDEDTGGGVLGSRAGDDGAVLAHDLDALHEVAAVVVWVLDVESVLALSGRLVELLARLLDLILVGLIVVVVLVGVLRLLARHALGSDHGGVGVREGLAVGEGHVGAGSTVLIGELGAGVVRENSEVDGASGLGAVGTKEVLDLFLLELTAVVVVVLNCSVGRIGC